MGSLAIDEKRYAKLIAKAAPRVIRAKDECDRALAMVESLMEKGERNMTREEGELLDLLTNLIRDYEAEVQESGLGDPCGQAPRDERTGQEIC